jgi:hypothetical protein
VNIEYQSGDHPSLTFPHAILVLCWMNGYGLSRMIDNNWRYWALKQQIANHVNKGKSIVFNFVGINIYKQKLFCILPKYKI